MKPDFTDKKIRRKNRSSRGPSFCLPFFCLVHLLAPLVVERSGAGLRDDVARVTADLARELEYLIRRAPEQWHLFQPNWPSDPGYDGPA